MAGGYSGSHKPDSEANNTIPGVGYNPNDPKSWLIYLDANNLYGWAMQQKLPEDNFE